MPRNAAGNYTLPLPPVISGNVIMADFENGTDNDIATELTNSLDRNGRGGMLAPFKIADGTVNAPGLAFLNDPSNGLYRIGSNDWAAAVAGAKVLEFSAARVTVPAAVVLATSDGSFATPAYTFTGNGNSGLFRDVSGWPGIAASGVHCALFHAGGIAVPATGGYSWIATAPIGNSAITTSLLMEAAGRLSIVNVNTPNDYRDLKLRSLTATGLIGTMQGGGGQYIWNLDAADGYHINNAGRQITVGGIQCNAGGGYINCIGPINMSSANAQATLAMDTTQAAGVQHAFNWSNAGRMWWQFRDSVTTLAIAAFNDSGVYQGDALSCNRTSKTVTIGGHLTPAVDNTAQCGTASLRWSAVYAVAGTIQTSDARMKKDVADSTLGLAFIEALRPVSYKWIVERNIAEAVVDDSDAPLKVTPIPGHTTHWGMIAQEVQQVVAAAGVDFGGLAVEKENPDAPLGLNYSEFIAPLIKAVQELSLRVQALEGNPA